MSVSALGLELKYVSCLDCVLSSTCDSAVLRSLFILSVVSDSNVPNNIK